MQLQQLFEKQSKDLIVKLAKEVPGFEVNVPQGAFYLFPKCDTFFGKSNGERKIADSDDFCISFTGSCVPVYAASAAF